MADKLSEVQDYPILGYASTGRPTRHRFQLETSNHRCMHVSKRLVPFVLGTFSLGIAIWIIIAFEGWWSYLIAVPLLAFGWPSIKTAFQATDDEIAELTGESEVSEETAERLEKRI